MFKLYLYSLIPILSLGSLPCIAAANGSCIGSGDSIAWKITDGKYFHNQVYSTGSSDTNLGTLQAQITRNFTCELEGTDGTRQYSRLYMKLYNGLECDGNDKIAIPNSNGLRWKLSGMVCETNLAYGGQVLRSLEEASITVGMGGKPYWRAGTILGSATLEMNPEEFWKTHTQNEGRAIFYNPSWGNSLGNNPSITITSELGAGGGALAFRNDGTCTMTISPENLDFGKLNPDSIKDTFREFTVSYSCINKAAANGLYIRFTPEDIVDSSNGTFRAKDANGRALIFKLSNPERMPDGMPLGSNEVLFNPVLVNITANDKYRVQVMPLNAPPYPSGKVSTTMTIVLKYR